MSKVKAILEVNNLTAFNVSKRMLGRVAEETLNESGIECLLDKDITVSVALVSEKEMAGLNLGFRKKDGPTDVLSFSEYAKIRNLCNNIGKDIFLGEVILCPEYIRRSSAEQEVSFLHEVAYIFSHGILHLLGFSHGKKMFSIQEKIVEKIGK